MSGVVACSSLFCLCFLVWYLADTNNRVEQYEEFWIEKVKPQLIFGNTIGAAWDMQMMGVYDL